MRREDHGERRLAIGGVVHLILQLCEVFDPLLYAFLTAQFDFDEPITPIVKAENGVDFEVVAIAVMIDFSFVRHRESGNKFG